ncbi:unnamed protein product [Ectocarpus sp. CCAP 1310/34]|nr:unnamed protein product [Ectocarpus sp. CCAP 1310/34]
MGPRTGPGGPRGRTALSTKQSDGGISSELMLLSMVTELVMLAPATGVPRRLPKGRRPPSSVALGNEPRRALSLPPAAPPEDGAVRRRRLPRQRGATCWFHPSGSRPPMAGIGEGIGEGTWGASRSSDWSSSSSFSSSSEYLGS